MFTQLNVQTDKIKEGVILHNPKISCGEFTGTDEFLVLKSDTSVHTRPLSSFIGGDFTGIPLTDTSDENSTSLIKTGTISNHVLKALKEGSNITISEDTDFVTITASDAASITLTDANTDVSLIKTSTGPSLEIKELKAGSNITLDEQTDYVEITATIPAETTLSLNNPASGYRTIHSVDNHLINTRSLTNGTGITLSESDNIITITNDKIASLVDEGNGSTLIVNSISPNLKLKKIGAEGNIEITENTNNIVITTVATKTVIVEFGYSITPHVYSIPSDAKNVRISATGAGAGGLNYPAGAGGQAGSYIVDFPIYNYTGDIQFTIPPGTSDNGLPTLIDFLDDNTRAQIVIPGGLQISGTPSTFYFVSTGALGGAPENDGSDCIGGFKGGSSSIGRPGGGGGSIFAKGGDAPNGSTPGVAGEKGSGGSGGSSTFPNGTSGGTGYAVLKYEL